MKRFIYFTIIFLFFVINVNATPGKLVKSSIVTCDNVTYGYHSNDKHWHVAMKNGNYYYAEGESLGLESPCHNTTVEAKENNITNETEENTSNDENKKQDQTTAVEQNKITVTLTACVDGDTAKFKTNKGIESTRFLAIDTPESTTTIEKYGKEASKFTCEKLTNATKIVLEFDKNSNKYDKYNRLLAWIWVDDVLLQDEIIKAGLGEVAYLYGDYTYTPLLQDHEQLAKSQKLNIWSDITLTTSSDENKNETLPNLNIQKYEEKAKDEENNIIYTILLIIIISIPILVKKKKRNS